MSAQASVSAGSRKSLARAMEGALVLQEPHSTFHRLAGLLQYTCNGFRGNKIKMRMSMLD